MSDQSLLPSRLSTVIHVDMDCYYAQVGRESKLFQNLPVTVVQNSKLLVTTNYRLRTRGIGKMAKPEPVNSLIPQTKFLPSDMPLFRQYCRLWQHVFNNVLDGYCTSINAPVNSCILQKKSIDESLIDCSSLTILLISHFMLDNLWWLDYLQCIKDSKRKINTCVDHINELQSSIYLYSPPSPSPNDFNNDITIDNSRAQTLELSNKASLEFISNSLYNNHRHQQSNCNNASFISLSTLYKGMPIYFNNPLNRTTSTTNPINTTTLLPSQHSSIQSSQPHVRTIFNHYPHISIHNSQDNTPRIDDIATLLSSQNSHLQPLPTPPLQLGPSSSFTSVLTLTSTSILLPILNRISILEKAVKHVVEHLQNKHSQLTSTFDSTDIIDSLHTPSTTITSNTGTDAKLISQKTIKATLNTSSISLPLPPELDKSTDQFITNVLQQLDNQPHQSLLPLLSPTSMHFLHYQSHNISSHYLSPFHAPYKPLYTPQSSSTYINHHTNQTSLNNHYTSCVHKESTTFRSLLDRIINPNLAPSPPPVLENLREHTSYTHPASTSMTDNPSSSLNQHHPHIPPLSQHHISQLITYQRQLIAYITTFRTNQYLQRSGDLYMAQSLSWKADPLIHKENSPTTTPGTRTNDNVSPNTAAVNSKSPWGENILLTKLPLLKHLFAIENSVENTSEISSAQNPSFLSGSAASLTTTTTATTLTSTLDSKLLKYLIEPEALVRELELTPEQTIRYSFFQFFDPLIQLVRFINQHLHTSATSSTSTSYMTLDEFSAQTSSTTTLPATSTTKNSSTTQLDSTVLRTQSSSAPKIPASKLNRLIQQYCTETGHTIEMLEIFHQLMTQIETEHHPLSYCRDITHSREDTASLNHNQGILHMVCSTKTTNDDHVIDSVDSCFTKHTFQNTQDFFTNIISSSSSCLKPAVPTFVSFSSNSVFSTIYPPNHFSNPSEADQGCDQETEQMTHSAISSSIMCYIPPIPCTSMIIGNIPVIPQPHSKMNYTIDTIMKELQKNINSDANAKNVTPNQSIFQQLSNLGSKPSHPHSVFPFFSELLSSSSHCSHPTLFQGESQNTTTNFTPPCLWCLLCDLTCPICVKFIIPAEVKVQYISVALKKFHQSQALNASFDPLLTICQCAPLRHIQTNPVFERFLHHHLQSPFYSSSIIQPINSSSRPISSDSSPPQPHQFESLSSNPPRDAFQTLLLIKASHIAYDLRSHVFHNLGFTTACGISTNPMLSKIASSTYKPNQQTIILPQFALQWLHRYKFSDVPGIGPKSVENLNFLNLTSINSLYSLHSLINTSSVLGFQTKMGVSQHGITFLQFQLKYPSLSRELALRLWQIHHGIDITPVEQSEKPKVVGQSKNRWFYNLNDGLLLLSWLTEQFYTRLEEDIEDSHRVPTKIVIGTTFVKPNPMKSSGRENISVSKRTSLQFKWISSPQQFKLLTFGEQEEILNELKDINQKRIFIAAKLVLEELYKEHPFPARVLGISAVSFADLPNSSSFTKGINDGAPKSNTISLFNFDLDSDLFGHKRANSTTSGPSSSNLKQQLAKLVAKSNQWVQNQTDSVNVTNPTILVDNLDHDLAKMVKKNKKTQPLKGMMLKFSSKMNQTKINQKKAELGQNDQLSLKIDLCSNQNILDESHAHSPAVSSPQAVPREPSLFSQLDDSDSDNISIIHSTSSTQKNEKKITRNISPFFSTTSRSSKPLQSFFKQTPSTPLAALKQISHTIDTSSSSNSSIGYSQVKKSLASPHRSHRDSNIDLFGDFDDLIIVGRPKKKTKTLLNFFPPLNKLTLTSTKTTNNSYLNNSDTSGSRLVQLSQNVSSRGFSNSSRNPFLECVDISADDTKVHISKASESSFHLTSSNQQVNQEFDNFDFHLITFAPNAHHDQDGKEQPLSTNLDLESHSHKTDSFNQSSSSIISQDDFFNFFCDDDRDLINSIPNIDNCTEEIAQNKDRTIENINHSPNYYDHQNQSLCFDDNNEQAQHSPLDVLTCFDLVEVNSVPTTELQKIKMCDPIPVIAPNTQQAKKPLAKPLKLEQFIPFIHNLPLQVPFTHTSPYNDSPNSFIGLDLAMHFNIQLSHSTACKKLSSQLGCLNFFNEPAHLESYRKSTVHSVLENLQKVNNQQKLQPPSQITPGSVNLTDSTHMYTQSHSLEEFGHEKVSDQEQQPRKSLYSRKKH